MLRKGEHTDSQAVKRLVGSLLGGIVILHGIPQGGISQTSPSLKPQIALGTPVWSFGGSGEPHTGLGAGITDVSVSSDGHVFVLVGSLGRVLALSPRGTVTSTYGRPGGGDGEFRNATGIAYDETTRTVAILDQASARVVRVLWTGTGFELRSVIAVSPFAQRICSMGGRLFVFEQSMEDSAVVQVYRVDSAESRFGEPFGRQGGPMMRMALRGAIMRCLPSQELVALVSMHTGQVRAYRRSGTLLWTIELRQFIPVALRISEKSAGIDPRTPQPWDLVDELFMVGGGDQIGVQFERAERPPGKEPPTPKRFTVFLSVDSGREVARDEQLPRLVSIGNRRAYSRSGRLSSTLEVFRCCR